MGPGILSFRQCISYSSRDHLILQSYTVNKRGLSKKLRNNQSLVLSTKTNGCLHLDFSSEIIFQFGFLLPLAFWMIIL